jgi:hypothetical protein
MRLLHTAIFAAVIFSQLGSASLREVAGARNLRVVTAMQARLLTEAAYTMEG